MAEQAHQQLQSVSFGSAKGHETLISDSLDSKLQYGRARLDLNQLNLDSPDGQLQCRRAHLGK